MNYNDTILDNKLFNFVKKLLYYIVLSLCIILGVCIVLVYGFHMRPYHVDGWSEEPYIMKGDLVVVKPMKEYKVGDIVKYQLLGKIPVTHRLIAITEHNGTTYYITHGDNVQNTDGTPAHTHDYKWEIERFKGKSYDEIMALDAVNIDLVPAENMEGKVIGIFANWGNYVEFISSHKILFIGMVIAIWCVTGTLQNEIDYKRSRRLL